MALPKKRRKTLSLKDRGSSDSTEDFPSFAPKVDNTLPEAPKKQEKEVAKAEKAATEPVKKTKVYTDERVDSRFPVVGNRGGVLNAGRGKFTIPEGVEADGVIGLLTLPADSIVIGGYVFGEDDEGNPTDVGGTLGWLDNAVDEEELDGIKHLGEMNPRIFTVQTSVVAKTSAGAGTKVTGIVLYLVP